MKLRVWRRRMTRRDINFFKSVDKLRNLMAYHFNKLSKQLQNIYQKSSNQKEKNK